MKMSIWFCHQVGLGTQGLLASLALTHLSISFDPIAKGALRLHTAMDTRLLSIRLVPGFDDSMLKHMIQANLEKDRSLKALVLQLYGTGNIPSVKESFIEVLADAQDQGVLVVAATQCFTGNVMLGHYGKLEF